MIGVRLTKMCHGVWENPTGQGQCKPASMAPNMDIESVCIRDSKGYEPKSRGVRLLACCVRFHAWQVLAET